MELKIGDVVEFIFYGKKRIGIVRSGKNGNYKVEVIKGGFSGCHNCGDVFDKDIGVNLFGSGVSDIEKLTKLELFKLL